MTLRELLCQFRLDADDFAEQWLTDDADRLWRNAELLRYAQEALDEYTRRRPIRDRRSPLTRIPVLPGTAFYPLSERLLALDGVRLDGAVLPKGFRENFDQASKDWRDARGTPECYLEDPDELRLQLVPNPVVNGELALEVRRLATPLLSWETIDRAIPEIPALDHPALILWMLHRAFSKTDVDTQDLPRAQQHLVEFNQRVGGIRLSARGDSLRRELAGWMPKTTAHY